MHTFAQKPKATQHGTPATVEQKLVQTSHGGLKTGPRFLGNQPAGTRWNFARIPLQPSSAPAKRLPGPLQRTLEVGAIDDPLEHEADRVADQVMRMPAPDAVTRPQSSRTCDECEEAGKLQEKGTVPQTVASEAPTSVHETLSSVGQPLDLESRAFFEPRFGADLSQVRVHADPRAAESAQSVSARAYTVGHHVVFGRDRYASQTAEGRHLLAHELAHTLQQRAPGVRRLRRAPSGSSLSEAVDPIEEESFPDYAWQKLITVETQGAPTGPHILGIVRENTEIPRALLAGAGSKFTYRKFVRAGTIRPSYSSFTQPGKGVVARAFAELEGYTAANKPSATELLKAAHAYGVYAFLPVAGSSRVRYSYPMPLSAATALPKDTEYQPASAALARPARRPGDPQNSLPNLLVRWRYAGLLDPPALPAGVAAIPPYPVTQEEAEELRKDLSQPVAPYLVAGSVVPFTTTTTATTATSTAAAALGETAPRFAAGTGSWTAAEATAAEGVGARVAGTALRTGLRVVGTAAAFVTVLTWEGPSAPAWSDTMNKVTGEPYGGPGEAAWDGQLTGPQRDYLRDLWRSRTQPVPEESTDLQPRTEPDKDKPRQRCSPTGLSEDDPIPMIWYKPEVDNFYPAEIEIQGHRYRRDNPRSLPRGEPIGVPREFWPRIGKSFQLLPVERGAGADDFRHTLTDYGFVWVGLQADHVQDLQWDGPDSFRNLWPLDSRQNPSAGTRQNNSQVVGVCVSRRGPYVTRSILDLKRSGFFYGRWFSISRVDY